MKKRTGGGCGNCACCEKKCPGKGHVRAATRKPQTPKSRTQPQRVRLVVADGVDNYHELIRAVPTGSRR